MNFKLLIALHILSTLSIALILGTWHWAVGATYVVAAVLGGVASWPALKAAAGLYEELRTEIRHDKEARQ